MSDGNFNRALLPKNELSAGIRIGKAQMRTKAEKSFLMTIEQHLPHIDQEQREQMYHTFMQLLRE